MNEFLKRLNQQTSDAADMARELAESGIRSVHEMWSGLQLFRSIEAASSEKVQLDETHYLLIPVMGEGYALYSKRVLPPEVGAMNSLDKRRVFHLPDPSGKGFLEQKLVAEMISKQPLDMDGQSDLADQLEWLADRFDAETGKITGGLLVIGGVVSLFNPVVGIGIAAKAILPSLGSVATKAGAGYLGGKLRKRHKLDQEAKLQKHAERQVKRLKPDVFVNPVIRNLEAIVSNPSTTFDPLLNEPMAIEQFDRYLDFLVTKEAITEVYQHRLNDLEQSGLRPFHVEWIRSFFRE